MITQDEIKVIYGEDALQMTKSLLSACDLASLIPGKDAKIGLKPNLVVAKPAESGATTHPEILAGTIEYLQEHGFHNLMILEGSWVGDSTERAFHVSGYDKLSARYHVPLFDTKKDSYVKKTYGGIMMEISRTSLSLDFLINMPVMKGHCQTIVTGAMKNLKGTLSDAEKRHFHALGLDRPIAYLNMIEHCGFLLGDGICGDLDFEEGGNPVRMNRIFAGLDPVLFDSYIASSMGYAPEDIGYIRIGSEIGVGSKDIAHARITELNHDSTKAKPSASGKVRALARYAVQKEACSACWANLIQALARLQDSGELGALADRPACDGQGFRNVVPDESEAGRLASRCPGIGHCTAGFRTHVEGCPPGASEILNYLRAEICTGKE